MSTLQATIEWTDHDDQTVEREITVVYDYYKATRGKCDSCGGVRNAGAPLEPDEPAHVDITSVLLDEQEILDELSPLQVERLEGKCLENESND